MNARSEYHKVTELELVEGSFPPLPPMAPSIVIEPHESSRLVFLTDPTGLAVERYKLLHHQLRTALPEGGLLLVTSPSSGDGKTLTSMNLAWCMAENKRQVCLLDLDLRRPSVANAIGMGRPAAGVVEVLNGKSTFSQAVRQVGTSSLYILGISEPEPSPARYLAPGVLRPLFLKLRSMFDVVIIDMPPAIPMSDVAEVLPLVDGALMIVRSRRTKKALISPTLEILGEHLLGVVLNDANIDGGGYYGYYGYGADRKRKKQS